MKCRGLFFLFTCLLMQKSVSGQNDKEDITMKKQRNNVEITCNKGQWYLQDVDKTKTLNLSYTDENSNYKCGEDNTVHLLVRIRTCNNCIELDAPALSAIIVGNLLATFLIACAVYSITGQPKGKNFSGNKASDRVNLITNGDGDTYQRLAPGQSSEYSGLMRKK